MRKISREWQVCTVKWLGWKTYGQKVVWLKPSNGKKIQAQDAPEYVKMAFDIDDRYISSYTDESALDTYKENGASISIRKGFLTIIAFKIETTINVRNPRSKERAKNALRDRLGRFIA